MERLWEKVHSQLNAYFEVINPKPRSELIPTSNDYYYYVNMTSEINRRHVYYSGATMRKSTENSNQSVDDDHDDGEDRQGGRQAGRQQK